jgi:predicted nucleotidyltransferase
MNDALPDPIVRELVRSHGAHTILLYGSRADGSAGPDSDWDVAAFADVPRTLRITRPFGRTFLDVFVYPEGQLDAPTQEHLKLADAVVVLERDGSGRQLMDKVAAIIGRGPEPLPPDELQARRDWVHKMLDRMGRGDAEGDYRRAWLLTMLLEDYFHLRGLWYRGPKKSLAWLAAHDPGTHAAFVAALKPGAPDGAIRGLVEAVVQRQTG